ncbi:MAG: MBL fold metallo-hydrolase [Gammaproteobacteria bacterium]|nr:MBL fold metallo-hydrolase [Gammaproteobacteria bacterium]
MTDEGILVFDTGGEVERAALALAAIREVSDKPILGVVYSHGHGDHTGGVDAFIKPDERGKIPIYAGRNYQRYLRESAVPRGLMRAYYQMGYLIPKDITGSVGSGIGPAVGSGGATYLRPTVTVEGDAGPDAGRCADSLFHSPGDLDDGLLGLAPGRESHAGRRRGVRDAPGDRDAPLRVRTAILGGTRDARSISRISIEHLLPGHLRA